MRDCDLNCSGVESHIQNRREAITVITDGMILVTVKVAALIANHTF